MKNFRERLQQCVANDGCLVSDLNFKIHLKSVLVYFSEIYSIFFLMASFIFFYTSSKSGRSLCLTLYNAQFMFCVCKQLILHTIYMTLRMAATRVCQRGDWLLDRQLFLFPSLVRICHLATNTSRLAVGPIRTPTPRVPSFPHVKVPGSYLHLLLRKGVRRAIPRLRQMASDEFTFLNIYRCLILSSARDSDLIDGNIVQLYPCVGFQPTCPHRYRGSPRHVSCNAQSRGVRVSILNGSGGFVSRATVVKFSQIGTV